MIDDSDRFDESVDGPKCATNKRVFRISCTCSAGAHTRLVTVQGTELLPLYYLYCNQLQQKEKSDKDINGLLNIM